MKIKVNDLKEQKENVKKSEKLEKLQKQEEVQEVKKEKTNPLLKKVKAKLSQENNKQNKTAEEDLNKDKITKEDYQHEINFQYDNEEFQKQIILNQEDFLIENSSIEDVLVEEDNSIFFLNDDHCIDVITNEWLEDNIKTEEEYLKWMKMNHLSYQEFLDIQPNFPN